MHAERLRPAYRALFSVMLVALFLVACGPAATAGTSPTATIDFPPLKPAGGGAGGQQPPGAWLIVGDKAFPATYGGYCYGGMCVDTVRPEMMTGVETAAVPADAKVQIRVGAAAPTGFSASVLPRPQGAESEMGEWRQLKADSQQAGDATVYTLEPIAAGEQLLMASAEFPEGSVSYIWHLNPQQ